MKVAIIGAGFTGLTAAIDLIEAGREVTVFESERKPGGLAIGFTDREWRWSLERYYHHIFFNDEAVKEIGVKVGLPAMFKIPKTSSFTKGHEYQLDSPLSLLAFPGLSMVGKIHMGMGLLLMKLIKNGLFLEKYRAGELLPKLLGKEGYAKIWEPLLSAKFGPYMSEVNTAWFWGRINKRTQRLGYFPGGFGALADKMTVYVEAHGGRVKLGNKVGQIKRDRQNKWWVGSEKFDQVLITTPAPSLEKILAEKIDFPKVNYLHAQTLVLELSRGVIQGYWLNILEKQWPFLVAVEHTNFMDRKYYGDKVLLYLGNYLAGNDKRLSLDDKQLIDLFLPYLRKINPQFEKKWIRRSWSFATPFAQPIFPVNYSRMIPPIETEFPGLFIANMSMVYPWDRGTNFAVEIGLRAAKIMKNG